MKAYEDLKSILRAYDIKSVAESANVCKSTLYFWLDGRIKKPRLDTFVKVAKALGYEVEIRKTTHLRMVA